MTRRRRFLVSGRFLRDAEDQFRKLNHIPTNEKEVTEVYISHDRNMKDTLDEIEVVYRDHGWPDLERYRKRDCINSVREILEKRGLRAWWLCNLPCMCLLMQYLSMLDRCQRIENSNHMSSTQGYEKYFMYILRSVGYDYTKAAPRLDILIAGCMNFMKKVQLVSSVTICRVRMQAHIDNFSYLTCMMA